MPEISQERLDDLIETENLYLALQSAGVDNWEGYSYAMEFYREMED